MTWWRVGSRPATAARSATVFPLPTSPVTTPSADSATQKLIRATASACAWRANRSLAAIRLPNGCGPGRSARPTAPGSRLVLLVLAAAGGEHAQLREVDLRPGAGLLVMGGGDQAQVVDTGRGGLGPGRLRDGPVHVPAGDERGGGPGGPAVQEHIDAGQVFGVIPQLDPAAGERGIDGVRVALEGDGGGAGDLAGHRPAERLAQQARAGLTVRAAGLEPVDRGLAGLGVLAPVGHVLGPGGEQVIQHLDRVDAMVAGLGQEPLTDIAVQSFLFSPPFR